jgi:CBS domain-containing protein
MSLSQIKSTVSTIRPDTTLREAARIMARDSVGALLISGELHGPVEGIITDRDIVKEIGLGKDPGSATVSDFFGRFVATISENSSRREVTNKMKVHGVRRLPVVNAKGDVLGIVSMDDLLVEMGIEMSDVGRAIHAEFQHEAPTPDSDE